MPGAGTSAGHKVIGETVIRSGNCEKCHIPFEVIEQPDETIRRCPECHGEIGELLVQFTSLDAEAPWGQRFEAARIKYAMLKRRERIPQFLRTGKCPFIIKIIFTLILERKLKRR
jgi:hypothetical protein